MTLNLSYNQLDGTFIIFLINLLNHNLCQLKYLNLEGNILCGNRVLGNFSPEPIFLLAQSLQNKNRSLKTLILNHCDIGARSTDRLMDASIHNPILNNLQIKNCNISGKFIFFRFTYVYLRCLTVCLSVVLFCRTD